MLIVSVDKILIFAVVKQWLLQQRETAASFVAIIKQTVLKAVVSLAIYDRQGHTCTCCHTHSLLVNHYGHYYYYTRLTASCR